MEAPTAEAIFAEWVLRRAFEPETTLEALCAQHGDLAPELRALHASWAPDDEEAPMAPAEFFDSELASGPPQLANLDPKSLGVERYTVIREIGRGGQGVVYLAHDQQLDRSVALKLLHGVGTFTDTHVQRFQREAKVASRLNHPGICGVFDAGVSDRGPYIVMEHVEGTTLAHRIAQRLEMKTRPAPGRRLRRLPSAAAIRRIVALVADVARALDAAHEAGVIHRDIKPGNIMVTPDGAPVVLDFGLAGDTAGALSTLTRTEDQFGTPAYMSPEQIRGAAHVDLRTDVYSLGATLYECLTLRRPFEAPTLEELYADIRLREPRDLRLLNQDVGRDLNTVVQTALAKTPAHRYQSAEEFAADLDRILAGASIRARPPGPLVRISRWTRRNQGVALAGLGLLVVLGGGWIWSSAKNRELRSALDRAEQISESLQAEERRRLAATRDAEIRAADVDRLASRQSALSKDLDASRLGAAELRHQADLLKQQIAQLTRELAAERAQTASLQKSRDAATRASETAQARSRDLVQAHRELQEHTRKLLAYAKQLEEHRKKQAAALRSVVRRAQALVAARNALANPPEVEIPDLHDLIRQIGAPPAYPGPPGRTKKDFSRPRPPAPRQPRSRR